MPNPTTVSILGLILEKVQRLLSLIKTLNPSFHKLSGKNLWMFDSEASCHMMRDLTMLQEAKKIAPVSIGLPNGTSTLASKEGNVVLAKNNLRKVLYVPSLRCNLISIAKLSDELNCLMIFVYCRTVFRGCLLEWVSNEMGFIITKGH